MRRSTIGILLALSLVGCTGAEVAGTVSVVGGALWQMFRPEEAPPEVMPGPEEQPTASSAEAVAPQPAAVVARRVVSEIPNILGVAQRITAGTPLGQVVSGVGGFLTLAAWLFTRRKDA